MNMLRAYARRGFHRLPPVVTNAMLIAWDVRTADEAIEAMARGSAEELLQLVGKNGRPDLDAFEACAASGTLDGLHELMHRLMCSACGGWGRNADKRCAPS